MKVSKVSDLLSASSCHARRWFDEVEYVGADWTSKGDFLPCPGNLAQRARMELQGERRTCDQITEGLAHVDK
ncbi:hypothetical protein Y032_0135g1908 [Ancylostoma ceylanicum]|uniref:Uncharacterized protein n=1 Tax=Ancylostoma ceylanicum TaxID=53326 RepID=A0A016T5J3_9BILA|nr:hypothetical protein Y032_0135g1908 [Ancylostoma ceylanicum]